MQPDHPSSPTSTTQTAATPAKSARSTKAAGAWASVCTDSTIEVAKGQDVAVRMYGRKKTGQTSPLVVHFHGGAFTTGDLDNGCTVATLLESVGAVVVSVAYPLTPFPQPVDTGYDVLKWVHRNRTKLGGQGALVYLAGEEAGGNLAAAVGLMARDQSHPPLAGQILLSPMLDPCVGTASFREATGSATGCKWAEGWRNFLRCPRDAEHPYAVPGAAHRLAGLPPTLILVGDTDPMHDEALAYAARLEAAGLRVTRHVFSKTTQLPDALEQSGPSECPCAASAQDQFRQFFEATRSPVPS
ncbi:MAG: alpha/beta hydrolase [Brevundimonas sp.]|uniref:alpha/beta hydrolase n=1 Tax=Brevundimonas sp. TaxID=1871086 RepID=UPI002735368C|nr:alpha/beta hydrolase [Brevundimonas sp.]MDP3379062.1 alpha/beta hydrolase [Brevundimonas sp.]